MGKENGIINTKTRIDHILNQWEDALPHLELPESREEIFSPETYWKKCKLEIQHKLSTGLPAKVLTPIELDAYHWWCRQGRLDENPPPMNGKVKRAVK